MRMKAIIDSSSLMPGLLLAGRAALAAAMAVGLAQLLEFQSPIFAMVGAVIVTDLSPALTRELGLVRLAGTALGGAVGATMSPLLPPGPFAVGFSILAAMFLSQLLRLRDAAKLTGYLCGIVILDPRVDPWFYAADRVIETALGIAVAVMVSRVPILIRTKESGQSDD